MTRICEVRGSGWNAALPNVITLLCFPSELRQVIANVVGNAIDAMSGLDHARLYLRVRDANDLRSGRTGFRITVGDTGSGISRLALPKIWEPFFTTKATTETGLGLWVAFEIIRKHQGTVSARSKTREENHGSIFSMFLPDTAALRE